MLQQLYWTLWGTSSAQKEQPGLSRTTGDDARGVGAHSRGAESLQELRPPVPRWPR